MKKNSFIFLICAFVILISNSCKKEKPNGSLHINYISSSGHVFKNGYIDLQVWDDYHQLMGSAVNVTNALEKDNVYSVKPGKYQLQYDVNYDSSSTSTLTGFKSKTIDIEILSEQEYLVNDTF